MPLDASPWTILSSAEVYANPWITVTEHQVLRPDGEPGIYGVVSCRTATGVVPLTEDGQVVLVGQWRVPFDAWSWEIPEGGAGHGEPALDAIQRELREETGYVAERWEPLGPPVHLSNSHTAEVAELFLATGLTHVGDDPDGDEVLEVIHVPLEEALAMVDDGRITDAMTVIALLRLHRRSAQPAT